VAQYEASQHEAGQHEAGQYEVSQYEVSQYEVSQYNAQQPGSGRYGTQYEITGGDDQYASSYETQSQPELPANHWQGTR
jgi:hypothetical protein